MAGAEILRTISQVSGDAEQSLPQIAEITARLFGASSVRIRLVENGAWGRSFHVGRSSEAIQAAVPAEKSGIGGRNLPGTVVAENRQIHIADLDNADPAIADWPGLPVARAAGARTISGTPLRREGDAIGALLIHRDTLLPFTGPNWRCSRVSPIRRRLRSRTRGCSTRPSKRWSARPRPRTSCR